MLSDTRAGIKQRTHELTRDSITMPSKSKPSTSFESSSEQEDVVGCIMDMELFDLLRRVSASTDDTDVVDNLNDSTYVNAGTRTAANFSKSTRSIIENTTRAVNFPWTIRHWKQESDGDDVQLQQYHHQHGLYTGSLNSKMRPHGAGMFVAVDDHGVIIDNTSVHGTWEAGHLVCRTEISRNDTTLRNGTLDLDAKVQSKKIRPTLKGFRKDYLLGDEARWLSDMVVKPTHEQAFQSACTMKKFDFAFIRRSVRR